jgi:hypothetical protein
LSAGCRAAKANGEPCRGTAAGPHGFCWAHAPENAEARRRAASRGGKGKANREVRDLKDRVRAVIADVRAGDLDRNDAAAMLQGYRVLLDYIKLERGIRVEDELAAEIEELKRERGRAS